MESETQHRVYLTRKFEIQTTPVTQAQWARVMKSNPTRSPISICPETQTRVSGVLVCPFQPVAGLSFAQAQVFILALNLQENPGLDCSTFEKSMHTPRCYRLPTEAEWEYSARAGTATAFYFGDDQEQLRRYAWVLGSSGARLHDVATLGANAFGLYDVHGSVDEWVQDRFAPFTSVDAYDPYVTQGEQPISRGGSYATFGAAGARSASRHPSSGSDYDIGLRLVRSAF